VSRLTVCVLTAICATPRPATSAEIDAVIARHVEWRGGARFAALRSIQRTGELRTAGLTGSIAQLERCDGYRRIDYDLGAIEGSETVTPSDA